MRQWYVLRSKPKKETSAASLLTSAGLEVYLPQAQVRVQRGKPPTTEPFFPGYLFARLDPQIGEIRLVTYTQGIQYVVGYGGEACPVPDELVLAIQERLARRRGRGTPITFRKGEPVLIASGPFREVEAIFDQRLSGSGRVQVLIRILDRLCRAEVDVNQIRRTSKAVATV